MADRITKETIVRAFLDAAFYASAGETSLSDIAGKLGIKKASLYNHFQSREDLVEHTYSFCETYLRGISFIPADTESVVKKYSAETVLKGIVSRHFKMHEKTPLFQIYTFIESQKYFSKEAARIFTEHNERIAYQAEKILKALHEAGKISCPESSIFISSKWFCSGISSLLTSYLLEKKQTIIENPLSGEGELFTLPQDEKPLEKINAMTEEFCSLLFLKTDQQ